MANNIERVRVGVVGTSWWADGVHLPSLVGYPRAEVVAICGRNRERAEGLAQKYGIPFVFTDYSEMLASGKLDAVVISAPDELHYGMTMGALDAGLHVLCEKPLALNAGHARAMYEKAEGIGVKHMTFYCWRWMPHLRLLRKLIDEGYIGRCYGCEFHFLVGFGRQAQYGWRYDRERSNGVVGDLGSHMVDLARWLVGEVSRVSAHLSTHVERPGAEGGALDAANDSAQVMLEFVDGGQGFIYVSSVAHIGTRSFEQRVTLHGKGGTLEAVFSVEGAEVRGARHDEPTLRAIPVPNEWWGDGDKGTLADIFLSVMKQQNLGGRLFVDGILEDRTIEPNFHDGWQAQAVIDAALEADRRGCWVDVPQTTDD